MGLKKDILRFIFDRTNKTIMLDKTERDSLFVILHGSDQYGRKSAFASTKCSELVAWSPDFVGVKYALGDGE